jgi:hypothetical protein
MSTLAIVISSIVFIVSSIFVIYGATIQYSYLKDESYFEYLWFIAMDWVLICGAGVGLLICLPILVFL